MIRIFYDYDEREIFSRMAGKILLEGIDVFRKNPYFSMSSRRQGDLHGGVLVIASKVLPMELESVTSIRSMTEDGKKLTHAEFLELLSKCHVYCTAIKSSFENPLVEAQMWGAVVMSTPNRVKQELHDPYNSIISSRPQYIANKLSQYFGLF